LTTKVATFPKLTESLFKLNVVRMNINVTETIILDSWHGMACLAIWTGDTIMVKSIFCFSSEKDLYLYSILLDRSSGQVYCKMASVVWC